MFLHCQRDVADGIA